MKNRIEIIIIISCLLTGISACNKSIDEFLDKAPGVDLVEDNIFSQRANVEGYVSTLYQYGMFSIMTSRDNVINSNPTGSSATAALIGTLSGATDESESQETFASAQVWNIANVQNNTIISNEDVRYFARWKAIRIANILLERIDEVPDADAAYRNQVKGEALFIRALQNFELLKRYGGFPIVNVRFLEASEAEVPRSTFEECVNTIIKDCEDAAVNLQGITYSASQTGRTTRLAVLALKSRTLLYAASPLFNTATPYLNMTDPANNNLICYGNYDANRWKLAADAAMAVLVEAGPSGVSLIDVPDNRNPTAANRSQGNYWVAWELRDNDEIIIADKTFAPSPSTGFPWMHLVPGGLNAFASGNSVTHNFVSKYEDTLGNVPFWDPAGGNDLVAKYGTLDPRFKQTVAYNGARWNAQYPVIETFVGATQTRNNPGGAWMIKHVPEALANGGSVAPSIALYRLNEFYLNYAEAMNEFQGPGLPSASSTPLVKLPNQPVIPTSPYDAVNKIRLRSGMPTFPAGLSQEQFRQRVHKERDIELAFEDHRLWDIRRWLIAENQGVMTGPIYGLRINRINAATFNYVPYIIENRAFVKRMYLHPYLLSEVLKGDLIQNPGW